MLNAFCSSAISMTTNLLITTITAGSNYYISHSSASPHHSANGRGTPNPSGSSSTAPPPVPPRALVFLTSEKTRKHLSTVHTLTGEAVKISTKTVNMVDGMIRRAMGAKPKRTKYFSAGSTAAASGHLSPNTVAPSGPSRSSAPSPSSKFGLAPPAYTAYQPGASEKPMLPSRRSPSPAPAASGPAPPPLPPRALKKKDHILISADLILSTIDDAARRILDAGTENVGKVVGHKYALQISPNMRTFTDLAFQVWPSKCRPCLYRHEWYWSSCIVEACWQAVYQGEGYKLAALCSCSTPDAIHHSA
jgi:spartin